MFHQFNPQRFRYWNGRRVGVVSVGTVIYIQECRPFSRPYGASRTPWIIEAWCADRGRRHLAVVRSLRDGSRRLVADWILQQSIDADFEWCAFVTVNRKLLRRSLERRRAGLAA